MTLLRCLLTGRARIRRGWCQNAAALDARGRIVSPDSRHAVKWCASGAIEWSYDAGLALTAEVPDAFRCSWSDRLALVDYNNSRGRRKSDILRLFDRAIATVRARRRKPEAKS